jgi:hypothetical protein
VLQEEKIMKRSARSANTKRQKPSGIGEPGKLHEAMIIAEEQGLLRGERTQIVRGRMPRALVSRAKKRTGIASDTDLIELALANIAVADDYADWLLSRRGAVNREADLEF